MADSDTPLSEKLKLLKIVTFILFEKSDKSIMWLVHMYTVV